MKLINERLRIMAIWVYCAAQTQGEKLVKRKDGFGMNEFLGIACALVIAALIIIPGLKTFSSLIMEQLEEWWTGIRTKIFQTT